MTNNLRPLSLIAAAMIGSLHAAPPVIDAVSERMKGFVGAKEIAGAVTLVADGETVLHLAALSPGSFGHGGAYGTQAWIDPVKKRIYVLMIQRADIGNGDASDIRRDFQNAAAQP